MSYLDIPEHRERIGNEMPDDVNYKEVDVVNPVARKNGIPDAPILKGRCAECTFTQTVNLAYSIWLRPGDKPYMKVLHRDGEAHRTSIVYRVLMLIEDGSLTDAERDLLEIINKEKGSG